jgi:hypothetical protein
LTSGARPLSATRQESNRLRLGLLLNTPPHRNLDGELGEDHQVDMDRDRDPAPNARR